MSYQAARNILKVNPDIKIPRMEIDWVRFYIDDTYTDHEMPYRKDLICINVHNNEKRKNINL